MREIGGYIELDTYNLPMLHDGAIALNCGRNCLAYIIRSKRIKSIKLPYFICESIPSTCYREHVKVEFYHIDIDFKPSNDIMLESDDWLYLINYYGQLSNDVLLAFVNQFKRVIIDNANAYFQKPLQNTDTIYTCRKYFGVADGAFLYTDSRMEEDFPIDESFERMHCLLGRFERTANEFYSEYIKNNSFFANEPIKHMSRLTMNLLHGIDYKAVEKKRLDNYRYLNDRLRIHNKLKTLSLGSFMYPFMIDNGSEIRKKLQNEKIYVPVLWPTVFNLSSANDLEYEMAQNILPLPIDQRYEAEDLEYMTKILFKYI